MGEFAEHVRAPVGRGHAPAGAATGAAGGAACGDLVRLSVVVAGDRVVDAGFDAAGCGAALREARGGGDVIAVTLELWADPANDGERSCCSAQAVRGARALAHRMAIPHVTLDLREEFRAGVVQPFLDDHAAGLTPNPCVRCNGHVRIDAMLELADRLGAGAGLATGHYARV